MSTNLEKQDQVEPKGPLDKFPEFSLPSPGELSLLTVILYGKEMEQEKDERDMCFRKATGIYIHAQIFLRGIRDSSQDDLLAMASPSLLLGKRIDARSRLVLDPSADSDPVRKYLEENGLRLKLAKTVWSNLRDLHVARALEKKETEEEGISEFEAMKKQNSFNDQNKIKYRLLKDDLDFLLQWRKCQRSEKNKKGHQTRKNKNQVRSYANTVKEKSSSKKAARKLRS